MNLYTMTNEFLEIKAQLEELELDQETLADTLDSLKAPLEEKVENIVKYMKSLEALADAKKAEAKRLSESASADLKKVEFFKNYLHNNLTKANIKELQAGVFKIGFRKGSEVTEVDVDKLPEYITVGEDFIPLKFEETIIKTVSKTELKKFVKEIGEIPGVQIVRNPDSLTIK